MNFHISSKNEFLNPWNSNKKQMLPEDRESVAKIPKSVLRYIWNANVYQQGLSLSKAKASDWFHDNPDIHLEMEALNVQLKLKIDELRMRAIKGLQNVVAERPFVDIEDEIPTHAFGQMLIDPQNLNDQESEFIKAEDEMNL